jgi:hypothetical protein
VTGALAAAALAEPLAVEAADEEDEEDEEEDEDDEPPEEQPTMRRAPPARTAAPARMLRIKYPFPIDLLGYRSTIYQTRKVGNRPATVVTGSSRGVS